VARALHTSTSVSRAFKTRRKDEIVMAGPTGPNISVRRPRKEGHGPSEGSRSAAGSRVDPMRPKRRSRRGSGFQRGDDGLPGEREESGWTRRGRERVSAVGSGRSVTMSRSRRDRWREHERARIAEARSFGSFASAGRSAKSRPKDDECRSEESRRSSRGASREFQGTGSQGADC